MSFSPYIHEIQQKYTQFSLYEIYQMEDEVGLTLDACVVDGRTVMIPLSLKPQSHILPNRMILAATACAYLDLAGDPQHEFQNGFHYLSISLD